MTTEQQKIVMPEPKEAISGFVEMAKRHFDYWSAVVATKKWGDHDKTELEAIALREYFEGQMDMAKECFRQLERVAA